MKSRQITALPSLVTCKDGVERDLDSLSETEKNEIKALMCKTINSIMSDYYTEHKDEWIKIANMKSA
ncbi:MAG: hypothetical protein ACI4SF_11005 [Oscillospiraceae bacterium]